MDADAEPVSEAPTGTRESACVLPLKCELWRLKDENEFADPRLGIQLSIQRLRFGAPRKKLCSAPQFVGFSESDDG